MKKILLSVAIVFFAGYAYAFQIQSDAFDDGAAIPSIYTCDSEDASPPLRWSDIPPMTKSFVLLCEDPDSPSKPWVHWVIFNIPASKSGLSQGVSTEAILADGSVQGLNDFGKTGYGGPCPPPTGKHRYFFKIYALDTTLLLDVESTKDDVLKAMENHVLSQTETFGTYER